MSRRSPRPGLPDPLFDDPRLAPAAFDPNRLRQARYLAEQTKTAIATEIGVSPAAVGQWESGSASPRPDHIAELARALDVPREFFLAGRPYARVDVGDAHFRSLRSTPASLRAKAVACTEQVYELASALERRVRLPAVDLPGFAGGEVQPGFSGADPVEAAAALRRHWRLPAGPIAHLVNVMEQHGLIAAYLPLSMSQAKKIDAFSTSHLPRPVVVLTPDRSENVFRHRFTAAHELGHLLLHANIAPGDPLQEKEADQFAAALLTPSDLINPLLPRRLDLHELDRLGRRWGVSIETLIYRCHEEGTISDATYRRAFQRLNQLRHLGLFASDQAHLYPGETPSLLRKAFELAERYGLTMAQLHKEIRMSYPRLRALLGQLDNRPELSLVSQDDL